MNIILIFIFMFIRSIVMLPVNSDIMVIESIMGYFNLKKCVVVLDERNPNAAKFIRTFSYKGIESTIISTRAFMNIMQQDNIYFNSRELMVIYSGTRSGQAVLEQIVLQRNSLRFIWLAFITDPNWNPLPIPFPIMFIWALPTSGANEITLLDYYTLKLKTRWSIVGVWSRTNGLEIAPDVFNGRYDLKGASLSVMRHYKDDCISYEECVHVELWQIMGQINNFSTKFIPEDEAKGIYLDAATKVTAFHANALASDPTIMDSIAPIWRYSVNLYVRHENDSFNPSSFRVPFTKETWGASIIWFMLATLCMALILWNNKDSKNPIKNKILFLAADAISNQSGDEIGPKWSKRMTICNSRLLALFLVPAYTASIKSILTLQSPAYPFRDLQGLVKEGIYKLTAENNSFMTGYFEYSNNPLSQLITEKYFDDQQTMPVTTEEGILKVCNGRFALLSIEEKVTGSHLPCKLLKIPTPAFTTFAGMHLAPGSEFRRLFFTNLVRFHTTGILNKLCKRFSTREIEQPENIMIQFNHIRPLLKISGAGLGIAVAIFIIEYYYSMIKRAYKRVIKPLKLSLTQRRKAMYYFQQNCNLKNIK